MDDKIDTVREVLKRILDEYWPMGSEEAKNKIVNSKMSALSAINPEAIRREMLLRDALARMYTMVSEPDFPTVPNKYYHHVINANHVLSAEPEHDDGKPELGDNLEVVEQVIRYHISAGGEYEYRGKIAMESFERIKRRLEEAKE